MVKEKSPPNRKNPPYKKQNIVRVDKKEDGKRKKSTK